MFAACPEVKDFEIERKRLLAHLQVHFTLFQSLTSGVILEVCEASKDGEILFGRSNVKLVLKKMLL